MYGTIIVMEMVRAGSRCGMVQGWDGGRPQSMIYIIVNILFSVLGCVSIGIYFII